MVKKLHTRSDRLAISNDVVRVNMTLIMKYHGISQQKIWQLDLQKKEDKQKTRMSHKNIVLQYNYTSQPKTYEDLLLSNLNYHANAQELQRRTTGLGTVGFNVIVIVNIVIKVSSRVYTLPKYLAYLKLSERSKVSTGMDTLLKYTLDMKFNAPLRHPKKHGIKQTL